MTTDQAGPKSAMKAAVYARVSTADKDQDPETQLHAVRRFCADKGWDVAGEYVDKASAADHRGRTAWRELVDFMGSVDIRPALTPFATQLANARALLNQAKATIRTGNLSTAGVTALVQDTVTKVQAAASDARIKNPIPLVVREPGQQAAEWGHALLAFFGDALYKTGTLYYVRKPLQDALFGGGG